MDMDDITSVIANNLKEIRRNRQLTLEALSSQSGVSISMLGEIERGVTNPTITILWKITEGLKIPFTELLEQKTLPVEIIRREQATMLMDGSGIKILTLFGFDPEKKFEIYLKILEPESDYQSPGHPICKEEYLLVCEGEIIMDTCGQQVELRQGDAIKFDGAGPHTYHNPGKTTSKAYCLLYYGQND